MRNYRKASDREREFIREKFDSMNNADLAKSLEISVSQVRGIYRRLGLRRIDGNGRFQKGQEPPNKGMKQTDYMSEESISKTKRTRFKKGNTPHNTVKVGTEVITKDGYTKVKIAHPNEWELKQRTVFKDVHSTGLNSNEVIIFKDGDLKNFKPENLKKLTREELMNKNSMHKYPKALKEIIKLNNKFIKEIKSIENGKK